EAVDPALHRRSGEADPVADVAQRAAGILGEETENPAIGGIELEFWFRHAIILGKSRTSRTNSCMASPFCSLLLRHVRPARFNCIMTVCESPAVLSPGDAARLETLDAVQ